MFVTLTRNVYYCCYHSTEPIEKCSPAEINPFSYRTIKNSRFSWTTIKQMLHFHYSLVYCSSRWSEETTSGDEGRHRGGASPVRVFWLVAEEECHWYFFVPELRVSTRSTHMIQPAICLSNYPSSHSSGAAGALKWKGRHCEWACWAWSGGAGWLGWPAPPRSSLGCQPGTRLHASNVREFGDFGDFTIELERKFPEVTCIIFSNRRVIQSDVTKTGNRRPQNLTVCSPLWFAHIK